MPQNHALAKVPHFLWSVFKNPVVIISFWLPTFVHQAFNAVVLESLLRRDEELSYSFNDLTVDMMLEWQLQLATLICAQALLLIPLISWSVQCSHDPRRRRALLDLIEDKWTFVIALLLPFIVSAAIIIMLVVGKFGTIQIIELYRSKGNVFDNDWILPPVNSPISWGRLGLIVAAVTFASVQQNLENYRRAQQD